jgi:hypothetical protein
MKKLFLLGLFLSCLFSKAANVTLTYDLIQDTNVNRVLFYIRTNGLINTNFALIATNQVNVLTTISNLPSGKDLAFYATTEDFNHLESEPSNVAVTFTPIGLPPVNYPVVSITSFDKTINSWRGVSVYWALPSTNYSITNYVVTFEGNGLTNRYPTLTNQFSLNVLTLGDYRIYVQSYNKEGVSPISTYTLLGKNPRRVLGFSAQ